MKDHGYSMNQMRTIQQYIRGTFGMESVESRAQEKLVEMTHELDEYFEARDEEFEEKDNKVSRTITRTLIVVTDTSEFILHLHEKLERDIHDTNVKAGFDYGGQCLKVRTIHSSFPLVRMP